MATNTNLPPDKGSPPVRKRARKPRTLGNEASDILFEKLPRPKGTKRRSVTHSNLHISKVYAAAIELKTWAVRTLLRMIKANDEAQHWYDRRNFVPADEFGDYEFADPGNANRALVILSIATIEPNDHYGGGVRLKLESWAADAGIKRYGRRWMDPADRAAIDRHTRKPESPYKDWTEWPSLPEPARRPASPKGPSFESMKFKPGESGNSRGRPAVLKYDLPYPGYLQKLVTVEINATPYRLTRSQALLHHLSTATL
ncbi:MAG: hypothetical protein EOP21_12360, partial [Hyphomicrobiales bacterium]